MPPHPIVQMDKLRQSDAKVFTPIPMANNKNRSMNLIPGVIEVSIYGIVVYWHFRTDI